MANSSTNLNTEIENYKQEEKKEGLTQESGYLNENAEQAEQTWAKILELLSDSIKQVEIHTWFSVIKAKSLKDGTLTIEVPSEDYYAMIEKRYNKHIAKIIDSGLMGENGRLRYSVAQLGLFSNIEEEQTAVTDKDNPGEKGKILNFTNKNYSNFREDHESSTLKNQEEFTSNLYSKNTFDNFVKGESNELAVAAAYAITNNPGKTYNPFFVYGGVGLGKTHLVQAIGLEILRKYPDKKVYYTTAPDFTTQFTTNIAKDKVDFSGSGGTKKLDSFYKSLDVLILDDIQNLSGKEKTQDFMYQIFNKLYNESKHIIFSSDKPINQIKGIEERLISRFQWGMTVDIQPPNWEMRVAIIQKKFEESGIDVPEEVSHYIASNIKDSIRTIEGCIVGMIAESALVYRGEINLDVAEKVINRVIGNVRRAKHISIENIIFTVAEHFKISENQILSRKRTKDVALARQVAMYLAKELTNYTLESIGLNFGGKDHATVLYSHKIVSGMIMKDENINRQVNEIKEKIKNL